MEQKTSKFNEKIKEILDKTQPGVRVCQETGEKFEIRKEDIEFYKMMLVPPPTIAPSTRIKLMFFYFDSDYLFERESALSGKKIITNIDPDSPFLVYDTDEWWSEKWDPLSYGVLYNPLRCFLEQWGELMLSVPIYARRRDPLSVNSDWSIGGVQLKNNYMAYGGSQTENDINGFANIKGRDLIDTALTIECEIGYELFECKRCYQSFFLENCEDCIECYFGFDLKNCESCFGCVNLRHKKYCFFNKQLTKEQYKDKIQQINLGSRKELQFYKEKFEKFLKENAIEVNLRMKNAENSVGDELYNCTNCYNSSSVYNSQNIAYSYYAVSSHDAEVGIGINNCKNVFQSSATDSYEVKNSDLVFNANNVEYCYACWNIENCFGCVGLRNKKFCILNRQYAEEQYWETIDGIKCDMLKRGEYGQAPPPKYSPFAYNVGITRYRYQMTKEEVVKMGGRWFEFKTASATEGADASLLPDDIKDASPDIIGKRLLCAETKRSYNIIKQEFDFYKKFNLPLPTTHWLVRRERLILVRWRSLEFYNSVCGRCGKEIIIRGTPEEQRAKKVCGDCCLKLVYDEESVIEQK